MSVDDLDHLVTNVLSSKKYHHISPDLVSWIGQRELGIRRSLRSAEKETRSKLHQVVTAYWCDPIVFADLASQLLKLPKDLKDTEMQNFCQRAMQQHASTRERLPILESFYDEIFRRLPPIHTILDVGCGLNPLALPWMKLAPDGEYHALDISQDFLELVSLFLKHAGVQAKVETVNVMEYLPPQQFDLVLALKMVPCLEQLDKNFGRKMMETLSSQHLVISFPVSSLGGRDRGMPQHYEQHFYDLCAGKPWQIEKLPFSSELVFLVHKNEKAM